MEEFQFILTAKRLQSHQCQLLRKRNNNNLYKITQNNIPMLNPAQYLVVILVM